MLTVGEWATLPADEGSGLFLIEQLTADQQCSVSNIMMRGYNAEAKMAVFFKPRCKMWNCPNCGAVNRSLWIMRVVSATQQFEAQGLPISFVTVTSHEKLSPDATIRVLPSAWHKLSMRARRKMKGLNYVVIPETHTDGRLHLHGIFMAQFSTRWWKDNARACGLGFMAEEAVVFSAAGAGWYTGKYLGKQLNTNQWAKGFRRVRTSLLYPKLPVLPKNEGWVFSPLGREESLSSAILAAKQSGLRVALADNKSAWTVVDAV